MRRALTLLLFAACSSGGGAPARAIDAGAVAVRTEDAAVEEVAPPAPDAGVSADPAERLRAGQALEQKQKWTEAIAALEQAASAGDATALQELAFAAVLAGDARRADAAARRLLDGGGLDDVHRATALYHLGRAAELRGEVAAARDAYQQSLALRGNPTITDRLARLGPRRPPPVPPAPPCARAMPSSDLCDCLGTELGEPAPARCVVSHRHGGGAWALTVVGRDRAPTYLVSTPAKGQAQVLATLGTLDDELTVLRWNVLRGDVVRVDARTSARDPGGKLRTLREDALVCTTGAAARCLASFPLLDRVGTPAVTRRLDLSIDAADGVAQLTLVEGPTTPADLLGAHRLW